MKNQYSVLNDSIYPSLIPVFRINFRILNIDRINRIAKGSGTNINDVVMLKKKMEELNSLVA